jgi:sarcosine oxidase subunit gamma
MIRKVCGAMAEFSAANPFGPGFHRVAGRALSIDFMPTRPILRLKVHRLTIEAAAAVAAAVNVPLPTEVNTVTGDQRRWLSLGPVEWLLIDEAGLIGVAQHLAQALLDVPHIVSDLGAALAPIALRGERARDLLAKGCPLDLHPLAFTVGACARTLLGGFGITLHFRLPDPLFELYIDVGVARHAAEWLVDGAAEFL